MKIKEKELFVKCSCYGEGALFSAPIEDKGTIDMLYVSFWSQGLGDPRYLRFKDKIRFIWQVIRKGRPYEDELVLVKKEAEEIRNYLNEILPLMNPKE